MEKARCEVLKRPEGRDMISTEKVLEDHIRYWRTIGPKVASRGKVFPRKGTESLRYSSPKGMEKVRETRCKVLKKARR